MLQGKDLTYAFWINDLGYPEHLYFGAPVGPDDLRFTRAFGATSTAATPPGIDNVPSYNAYPSELSFFGTGDYREPAVQIVNPAGDRLCELLFDSYDIVKKPKIRHIDRISSFRNVLPRFGMPESSDRPYNAV